ncbi:helix-turn-helix domain-containing protein [Cyanobacteria bacterium FACHB-63]|nr:helix-turn-helix domain-containing protein [Cyanobacteria bacterium FACHB-63]
MAKTLNAKQLEVLQRLALGESYREIESATGTPSSTINRWRRKFASVLQEQSEEIGKQIFEGVSTARLQSVELLQNAFILLNSMQRQAETFQEKAEAISLTLKCYQVLNPVQTQGSVTVQPSEPSTGQVLVMLPSNGREQSL